MRSLSSSLGFNPEMKLVLVDLDIVLQFHALSGDLIELAWSTVGRISLCETGRRDTQPILPPRAEDTSQDGFDHDATLQVPAPAPRPDSALSQVTRPSVEWTKTRHSEILPIRKIRFCPEDIIVKARAQFTNLEVRKLSRVTGLG